MYLNAKSCNQKQSTITEFRNFNNSLQKYEIFMIKYEGYKSAQKLGQNDNRSSLSLAMEKLFNAVDEQHVNTQKFKKSVSELKNAILKMKKNAIGYKANLA